MDPQKKLIRDITIEIISGKEKVQYSPITKFGTLEIGVAEVMTRKKVNASPGNINYGPDPKLSAQDTIILQEVFWDLFREKIITIGFDESNPNFPSFRLHSEAKL